MNTLAVHRLLRGVCWIGIIISKGFARISDSNLRSSWHNVQNWITPIFDFFRGQRPYSQCLNRRKILVIQVLFIKELYLQLALESFLPFVQKSNYSQRQKPPYFQVNFHIWASEDKKNPQNWEKINFVYFCNLKNVKMS